MSTTLSALAFVVYLFLLVLVGRVVFQGIRTFARDWRPRGVVLLVAEPVYTMTEPPIRALRRFIPPLRVGGATIDLSFLVLFVGVVVVREVLLTLARASA
ncbi:YggT family protein [Phycicoccus sp. CSK15P-2]|uniref:YggT family protein n=1 Tax=Phycicoccus sp. CSK15P-2 TaxID=2807627 RepID=UPI001951D264|nr:YggT family protein [Phycicoccus sp. CSK15P-2]MBM6404110.1 YggT family protein [Phycicoccus sp. CSK15P-2]